MLVQRNKNNVKMDEKLVEIAGRGSSEEIEKYLDSVQLNQILKALQLKVSNEENIGTALKAIFKGSRSDTVSAVERSTEAYKFAITLMKNGELPSSISSELVGILLIETDNLPPSSLAELAEMLINTLKSGKMPGSKWLEIVPKVLSSLTSKSKIVQNNMDMSGADYKNHLFNSLLLSRWEPECAVQLGTLFRDMSLTNEELQNVTEKFLRMLPDVVDQELPPLIYQLLLLSSKGCRKQLLDGMLQFFKDKDRKRISEQTHDEGVFEAMEAPYNVEAIRRNEGTIILHITFATKQDHEIGREFVKMLKAYQRNAEEIMSPFFIALALAMIKVKRFEEQITEGLKNMILCYFQEAEKKTNSYWMRKMLSSSYDLRVVILSTIKSCKFGLDYIVQGLVQLGFALLDTYGPKPSFGRIPDTGLPRTARTPSENACFLGAEILQQSFKVHESFRDEILQQILNRVIIKTSTPVLHYIEVLAKTIQAAPQQLLDVLRKFREVTEYLPFLPFPSAISLLRAITPLLKISPPLKDSLMIVLRKALFHRDIEAHKAAVAGFLVVLRNFKLLNGTSITQEAQRSQSAISLSQVRIEMHATQQPGSFEALCLELLGTLQRVFTQQADVRTVLYEGIHEVLCRNPHLSDAIIELLTSQFEKCYESNEDACPPLKLESCLQMQCEETVIIEPFAYLLRSIQLCVTTMLQQEEILLNEDNADLDDQPNCHNALKSLLDSLKTRILATDLDDFGLEKSDDFSEATTTGKHRRAMASLLLGIYEVLMEYSFNTGGFSAESFQEVLSLYVVYNKVVDLLKDKPTTGKRRGGQAKGKKANDLLQGKSFKSMLTLKFVASMLKALFCDDDPFHQDGLVILRGTNLGFSQHFINIASTRIVQFQEKGKCDGICRNNEEAFECFFDIAIALYHHYQNSSTDLPIMLSCSTVLSQLFTLFCSHYPHQLIRFLGCFDERTNTTDRSSIIFQHILTKRIKTFQEFATVLLSDKEDAQLKNVIPHLHIIGMLCKHLTSDSNTIEVTLNWAKQHCTEKEITDPPVAKALLTLCLGLAHQTKSHITLLRDIFCVLHCRLGDIDEDASMQADSSYSIINARTASTIFPLLIEHVEIILDEIEWILSSVKSCIKTGSEERKNRENNVCHQLGHLITLCHELVQTSLTPGPVTEATLKIVTRIYNTLSSFTKYYVTVYSQKTGEICPKFERMVKLSATLLNRQVYSLITYIESADSAAQKPKKRKLDRIAEKAKVIRETKPIPLLIHAIERYENHLIQLGKKSKMDLMGHFKLATSRDFRINPAPVQAVLDQLNEDDTQDTTSEQSVLGSRENISSTIEPIQSLQEVQSKEKRAAKLSRGKRSNVK